MLNNIILASKSKVRKNILEKNKISCNVKHSYVDEEMVKESILNEKKDFISSKDLVKFFSHKQATLTE